MKTNSPAKRLAFCSMMAAVSVAIMWMSNVLPILVHVSPFLACMVLIPVLCDYGALYAWLTWAAITVLSLLLCTERDAAFIFLFIGYYPIIKPRIEKIGSGALRIIVKLAVFASAAFLVFVLLRLIMGARAEGIVVYAVILICMIFIVAMFFFDRAYGTAAQVWEEKRESIYKWVGM